MLLGRKSGFLAGGALAERTKLRATNSGNSASVSKSPLGQAALALTPRRYRASLDSPQSIAIRYISGARMCIRLLMPLPDLPTLSYSSNLNSPLRGTSTADRRLLILAALAIVVGSAGAGAAWVPYPPDQPGHEPRLFRRVHGAALASTIVAGNTLGLAARSLIPA